MCTVCGCGEGETRVEGHDHDHDGQHGAHHHSHHHHDHDYGQGPARAHAPGMGQSRMVAIEQDILSKNNAYASANRKRLAGLGILALNLVSSPGSGKTTLLTATLSRLGEQHPVAVIEGDQQTSNDAERIRATGVPAVQINTGKGCHLDAHMVGHALDSLPLEADSVLFIENVGNLVCPAAFDLGEAQKVAILSVTEGDDKPIKYPDMFAAADLMLLNKIDLLPYVPFDADRCIEYARRVNPAIEVISVSALKGDGMGAWLEWIGRRRATIFEDEVARLERRLAELRARGMAGAG
jgi:hydrogenase nickel incorporation protein HypB